LTSWRRNPSNSTVVVISIFTPPSTLRLKDRGVGPGFGQLSGSCADRFLFHSFHRQRGMDERGSFKVTICWERRSREFEIAASNGNFPFSRRPDSWGGTVDHPSVFFHQAGFG